MPLGDFAEPGTTPRPLAIGRVTRLGFAIYLGVLFILYLLNYTHLAESDFPVSGPTHIGHLYWIAVVFAWWFFSDLVVVGFGRRWGRWPQIAVLPVALALVLIDLVAYGEIWELPLSWGVFLFTEFVFGYFAISFFLAAAFAVPGWEFRGVPHVLGLIRGRPAMEHP